MGLMGHQLSDQLPTTTFNNTGIKISDNEKYAFTFSRTMNRQENAAIFLNLDNNMMSAYENKSEYGGKLYFSH